MKGGCICEEKHFEILEFLKKIRKKTPKNLWANFSDFNWWKYFDRSVIHIDAIDSPIFNFRSRCLVPCQIPSHL